MSRPSETAARGRSVHRSTCPYDCPDACGLVVEVEDGKAVAVRGDPEHPWSRGTLCPKMVHYERTVHSPRRLVSPLVRTGPKGAGEFRRASWDEAITAIAGRFRSIVAEHGAEAILPYSYAGTMGMVQRNAGHALFHALGASRLDRTICTPAQDAGFSAVMGDTLQLDPEEAVDSDLVVLWGIDAIATHIHFVPRLKAARAKGARVVVVETYRSPTAALADDLVLVRPGTDGALALGLMHVLARDGLVDGAFVDAHVQGWGELAERILPEWTPARAAEVTGVAAEDLERFAHAFGRARAPFIRHGGGPTRYGNGAMSARLVACLPAVVGAWARRGGGMLCSTSSSQAFDTGIVQRPDLEPRACRTINMNQLGTALTTLDAPPVKALFVYCSNPAAVAPDQNAVLRGLSREDLFTVVHERFLTDTARFADVVLPATSSLEHGDLYRAYGSYCVQRTRPVVDPVGESLPNWEVFARLARAMGVAEAFYGQSSEAVVDALLAKPSALREAVDPSALAEGRPCQLSLPPGAKLRFRTPSGRIEILNPRQAHPLPRWIPPHSERGALPFRLITAPAVHALNSSFHERDELRERIGPMPLRMHPDDAAARSLRAGERVVAWNELGEATFTLDVTEDAPLGMVVAPGVFWLEHVPGARNVNALTSQKLTDEGRGSTFYDNRVDVRPAPPPADTAR
ncbi:MAG TPA: molybdopterin oxidoreductase family protein [Anaeromyxobacteraceae bacterium]|nr:molybdopterin oxidoreductase family protein [Anaeromyxobacteraceae bacterium]